MSDAARTFVDRVRQVALDCGYAIGVHGSEARDLDLIAAPWTVEAVSAQDLVDALCAVIPLTVIEHESPIEPSPEAKPWGRLGWSFGGCPDMWRYLDLSICPRSGEAVPIAWSHRRGA